MMGGDEWMVVLIVAIVVVGKLISRAMGYPGWGGRRLAREERGDAALLRQEVSALRDRLAVLERIATDDSHDLDRRIEALRDPARRVDRIDG